ncbi:MAG: hypothetical protein OEZ31_07660 [Nitrospirota bacterium]|nr:hypothetical protein [Nitrospirota bacterium]MDH5768815.1 hypothetical protein [Nitrospirota bacterium]
MNRERDILSPDDIERAERLREVIEKLSEINKTIPILVEGKKDADALRTLGLVGEIITVHRGKSIYDFCLDISERFHRVIILPDWDKTGENLNKALSMHLRGHYEEYSSFRELLKILCQKEIKDIEGIPTLLRRLEGDEGSRY